MGFLNLNAVTVNGNKSDRIGTNYYQNDDAFQRAKDTTKSTPAIFGEKVTVELTNDESLQRDLRIIDILAKYIGGVSGLNNILGSALEKAVYNANKDDFEEMVVTKDGKDYKSYRLDYNDVDGRITDGILEMPTLQQDENGNEFYVIGTQKFDKFGNEI